MTYESRWTCARCGALLGLLRDGQLTIRHKRVEWVVGLPAATRCRRCDAPNRIR